MGAAGSSQLHSVHSLHSCGAHTASYPMGAAGSSTKDKVPRIFPGVKGGWPTHNADNLSAICELIV
jgi:hypothetical protein